MNKNCVNAMGGKKKRGINSNIAESVHKSHNGILCVHLLLHICL